MSARMYLFLGTCCLMAFLGGCWSVSQSVSRSASAKEDSTNYSHERIFYSIDHGVGFLMDVYVPKGKKNGLGVIFNMNGGWLSHEKQSESFRKDYRIFDILSSHGYTVFSVWPGSRTKFSVDEMVGRLKTGIRWVKVHSQEYHVDPNRLGLMGVSAGGHMSLLALIGAEPGNPKDPDPLNRQDTRIKAAAVMSPVTDFLDTGGTKTDLPNIANLLLFPCGMKGLTEEEIRAKTETICPARLVKSPLPPLLFVHGDADQGVPIQQSQKMIEALRKAGGRADFIIKKGGGHFWPTEPEEVAKVTDWFDRQLVKGDWRSPLARSRWEFFIQENPKRGGWQTFVEASIRPQIRQCHAGSGIAATRPQAPNFLSRTARFQFFTDSPCNFLSPDATLIIEA
jgi:acetyl esterase/lipase